MPHKGNALWAELHKHATNYRGDVDADAERAWLRDYQRRIHQQCGSCGRTFDAVVASDPPILHQGAKGFFLWTVRVHNRINKSLGKRVVFVEAAEKLWGFAEAIPQRVGRIKKANGAGLLYNLNGVVQALWLHPSDPLAVDWRGRWDGGFKYGSPAGENVWDELFEPLTPISDIPNPIEVFERHPPLADKFVSDNIAKFYRSSDPTWRYLLNAAWRRIRMQPETQRRIDQAIADLPPGPRIACHVRNAHHAGEQPGRRMPTLAQMIEASKDQMARIGAKALVLGCDNEEAVSAFRGEFGDGLYVAPAYRAVKASDPPGDTVGDGSIERAFEVLTDVARLAACDHLVSVCSNVSTAALYWSPTLVHTFVEAK